MDLMRNRFATFRCRWNPCASSMTGAAQMIAEIEGQDKLTPQLREQILSGGDMAGLEDLYQPYKPKRRTRASMAREKGLQPLADMMIGQVPDFGDTGAVGGRISLGRSGDREDALAGCAVI